MSRALTRVEDFPSVPQALKTLDRLEGEIAHAPSFKTLDAIADEAAGLQRKFRRVEKVAARAGRVWVAADVRLGQEWPKVGKAKGAIGRAGPGRGKRGSKMAPRLDDAPTIAELGIAKKRLQRAERLAAMPTKVRDGYIAELEEAGKGVTPNAVLVRARQKAKRERHQQALIAVFSEDGPFDVVVIDPPWKVEKIDRDERPNQDAFDYPTMTIEDLGKFWPDEIAGRLKDDVHIFCWTTEKYLLAAIKLVESWGLRYVLTMVWHKPGGFQPVGLPQYNCEFIIYARKGAPVFIDTKDFDCCFEAPRREHSRKPDKFYDTIRRVTGGSRIDVFSREPREGFAQYGNEADKFPRAAE
jgi:N6-adenosine-specific RNA methylase IME4